MLWLPTYGSTQLLAASSDELGSTSPYAFCTVSGVNVLSSWTVLYASTPWDAQGIWVSGVHNVATLGTLAICDLGIGSAGNEVPFIEGLNASGGRSNDADMFNVNRIFIPFFIPAGSRVVVRGRASAAASVRITAFLERNTGDAEIGLMAQRYDPYGITHASCKGVDIPTSGIDTWSSWVELTASTTRGYRAILPVVYPPNTTTYIGTGCIVEFAIGAAGAESVFSPPYRCVAQSWEQFMHLFPNYAPLQVPIPEGSRISCRMMGSNATNDTFSAAFFGVL